MRRLTKLLNKLPIALSIVANMIFAYTLVAVCQDGVLHSDYLSKSTVVTNYQSYKTGYLTAIRDFTGIKSALDKGYVEQSERQAKAYIAPIEELFLGE